MYICPTIANIAKSAHSLISTLNQRRRLRQHEHGLEAKSRSLSWWEAISFLSLQEHFERRLADIDSHPGLDKKDIKVLNPPMSSTPGCSLPDCCRNEFRRYRNCWIILTIKISINLTSTTSEGKSKVQCLWLGTVFRLNLHQPPGRPADTRTLPAYHGRLPFSKILSWDSYSETPFPAQSSLTDQALLNPRICILRRFENIFRGNAIDTGAANSSVNTANIRFIMSEPSECRTRSNSWVLVFPSAR